MKKSLFSVLLVSMLLVLASCEPVVKQKVVVEYNTLEMYLGQTYTLKATIEPAMDAPITWTSSNMDVVSVDNNGKLTALTLGSATISATVEGLESAQCQVTVKVS